MTLAFITGAVASGLLGGGVAGAICRTNRVWRGQQRRRAIGEPWAYRED